MVYYTTKLLELTNKIEKGNITQKEEEFLVQLIRWDNELENKVKEEGLVY